MFKTKAPKTALAKGPAKRLGPRNGPLFTVTRKLSPIKKLRKGPTSR